MEHDWASLPCSGRRPNPTVAPREVKLRFWFFAAGCRFLLHNVAIFFRKLHHEMNRVNVFAIHRCINEGYGLIQIFTEKIRISPTKLWHVWAYCAVTTEYGIASDFLRTSSSECKARGPVVALTNLQRPLRTVRHRASFPVWSDCDRLRCPWTVSAVVPADTAGSAGNTGRRKCLQETAPNGCTNLFIQHISQIYSGVFTIKTINVKIKFRKLQSSHRQSPRIK